MAASWALTPPAGVESTFDITANSDVRDVSDVLDAVYVADTPFINKIGWGEAAHNKIIEWVSDSIGYGYLILSNGGTVASDASSFVVGTSGTGAQSTAIRQIHTGSILKHNASPTLGYMIVEDLSTGGGSITFAYMSDTTQTTALTDGATLFIIGNAVPEGSSPRDDTTRPRAILSNKTQIFRKDVRITGTRQATDMYAVGNELRHQIDLRTKEYKRELETTAILGRKEAGSTVETQTMGGLFDYLRGQSGTHIDTSSTSLTESLLNTIVRGVMEKGGVPDCVLVGFERQQDISSWDVAKKRTTPDSRQAGYYTTQYLSDLGAVLDVVVSRWVPANLAFILSSSMIKLCPLRGRKFILEKLGKVGDYVEYQLLSEVSMQFNGYNLGQHGMLTALT